KLDEPRENVAVFVGVDFAGVEAFVDFENLGGEFAHRIFADAVGENQRIELDGDWIWSQVVMGAGLLIDTEADESGGGAIGLRRNGDLLGKVARVFDRHLMRGGAGEIDLQRSRAGHFAVYDRRRTRWSRFDV